MTASDEAASLVLSDLCAFVGDEVAATVMALGSLRTLAHQVVTIMESGSDADGPLLVGNDVPDVGWIPYFETTESARTYASKVASSGAISQRLTQQLIVTIDTAWEHEFRARLAAALGLPDPNQVTAEFFRDLRWLRNDIVHHRGVTTANKSARCTTFMRRFTPGTPIYLDDRDLMNLRFQIPLAELSRP